MIDWARAAELQDEVGAEDFMEVVELFLEEVDSLVTRLVTAPDPDSIGADMHFLKGSALNLGFSELGKLCRDGEVTANTIGPDQVDIAAIAASFTASRAAFLAKLPDL